MSSGAATLLSLTVSVVALAALGAAVAQRRVPAEHAREPIDRTPDQHRPTEARSIRARAQTSDE